MRRALPGIVAISVCCIGTMCRVTYADWIDFETGFGRRDVVSTVFTPSNSVTLWTQGMDNSPLFIAQVGTTPKDAFEKVVAGEIFGDTPEGGEPGDFFATVGAGNSNRYLFDLGKPVTQFSLDLYDYVGDGGARPADFATLRAYADLARAVEVATDVYTIPRPRPADGLAVTLSVTAPSIAALTLDFSTFDRGTGIDNIRFQSVPEPSALAMAISSLAALSAMIWHRGRGCRRRTRE